MIVIRLSRVGKRNQAIFRIVVAEKEKSAKGKFIESLGSYNPRSKKDNIKIDQERINYWLKKGAQPSLTMTGILKKEGILPEKLVKDYDLRIAHIKKFKKNKKKKEEGGEAEASGDDSKKEEKVEEAKDTKKDEVKSEPKIPDADKKEEKKESVQEKPGKDEKKENKQEEKS